MNRYHARRPSRWRFRLTVVAEAAVLVVGFAVAILALSLAGLK